MILYNRGRVNSVNDSRVRITPFKLELLQKDSEMKQLYKVDVDGFEYMYAIGIYMEHKQFLELCAIYDSIDLHGMFPDFETFFVLDAGIVDKTSDGGEIKFNDYTEKGREGICYFSDIITERDKSEEFKRNYIGIEVMLK